MPFNNVVYDQALDEWQCRVDGLTVVCAATKEELEQKLDWYEACRDAMERRDEVPE